MLKSHPGHTYLQLGVGANFLEQGALLQKRFPGQIYLHYEFVRGRGPSGEFGTVIPVLLPAVKFVSEDHLREIIAYCGEIGIVSNNPHTCYLGELNLDDRLREQAKLKLKADPKGLLNPGKLKGANSHPTVAAAFPNFLYPAP